MMIGNRLSLVVTAVLAVQYGVATKTNTNTNTNTKTQEQPEQRRRKAEENGGGNFNERPESRIRKKISNYATQVGFFNDYSQTSMAAKQGSVSVAGTRTVTDNQVSSGSQVTDSSLYPWFVRIGLTDCGGTMIWPGIVATTARCIFEGIPSSVRVGAISADDGITYNVKTAYYHNGFFNEYPFPNDIAILVLDLPSDTDFSQLPIAILNRRSTKPEAGTPLSFIGFGETESNAFNNVLNRLTTYESMSGGECLAYWESWEEGNRVVNANPVNADGQLCAMSRFDTGACAGDGGGPLFDSNKVVMGFVSFGDGFCGSEFPEIFSRTSEYYQWLYATTCAASPYTPEYCPRSSRGTSSDDCGASVAVKNFFSKTAKGLQHLITGNGGD